MACKDPSITFLNKFGYNVVKLPRTGIEPMDTMGRDKNNSEWLGPLASVWKSTIAAPVAGPPQAAVTVEGQKSDKLDLSIGLKVLANALTAFGATTPSLDVAFTKARKVTFTFTNVTSTSVAPLVAGNYLAAGDLNSSNPVVRRYFLDEDDTDGQAYLIFDVLKSDTVTVTATNDSNTGVTLDVPAIQGLVGAKVGVNATDSSSSTLSFKGPAAVTFGFKVMEINFSNGRWTVEGAKPDGALAFSAAAAAGGGLRGGEGVEQPILLRAGMMRI